MLLLSSIALAATEPTCDDAATTDLATALNTSGFAVLRQAFSPARAARALAALSRPGGMLMRDAIWMRSTERIAQVLELDDVFGELLELPDAVDASFERLLGPGFMAGSVHALVLHPEPPLHASGLDSVLAANLHSDYPYGHATPFHGGAATALEPQWPHTMQVLWMLTDFTEENGATLVLPGSHRTAERAIPQRVGGAQAGADFDAFKSGAVAVTGRAGDVMVYNGQLWHSVGVNQGSAPRAALLGQYLPFFMAPMEAHARTTPMRVQRRLSPRVRRSLGLPWDHFFQSMIRLAPLPRGPLGAAAFVLDALWEGYAPLHHPEMLRHGVKLAELPAWLEPLALALAPAWLQLHRWLALGAMLGGPAAVAAVSRRRRKRGRPPPDPALVCAVALGAGLLLGCNLALEKVRM